MRHTPAPALDNPAFRAWLSEHGELCPEMLRRAALLTDYLSWDELRYRAPEGMSASVWWSLVLLSRSLLSVSPLLRSPSGQPFLFTVTSDMQAMLFETERRLYTLPSDKTAIYREAAASAQMEGADTSTDEALRMLASDSAPKTHGEWMIFNVCRVLTQMKAWARTPLSGTLLSVMHRMITQNLLPPEKQGAFRSETDAIVVGTPMGETVYTPPSAGCLPERMAAFIAFANASGTSEGPFVHPILKAILLHTLFAYEHPYCDGNGRMARALFYWSLLRSGYVYALSLPLSVPLMADRKRYDRAYLAMESCALDTTYCLTVNLRALTRN